MLLTSVVMMVDEAESKVEGSDSSSQVGPPTPALAPAATAYSFSSCIAGGATSRVLGPLKPIISRDATLFDFKFAVLFFIEHQASVAPGAKSRVSDETHCICSQHGDHKFHIVINQSSTTAIESYSCRDTSSTFYAP
jgi:hypothetical protein